MHKVRKIIIVLILLAPYLSFAVVSANDNAVSEYHANAHLSEDWNKASLSSENSKVKQGLYFYSYEANKDKRTSLNLTPKKPFSFPGGFSMDFDFKLRAGVENFGYIFRAIGNDDLNIDLISDINSLSSISLIVGNKTLIQFKVDEISDFQFDKWMSVSLFCNPVKDSIILSINSLEKRTYYDFSSIKDYQISFGGNSLNKFSITDVPPMTVKDIRIFDGKKRLVYNWKLSRHNGDYVYDECKKAEAVTSNPFWEIDNHAKWTKRETIELPQKQQQIAYDELRNRIFIVHKKNIAIYNVSEGTCDVIEAKAGVPFNLESNQLVYDKVVNRLISYSFDRNRFAYFDFDSQTWNNENYQLILPRLSLHHTKYYFSSDSLLVTFGGYGFHEYSALVQEYSMKERKWNKKDLSWDITPRYLGSMGFWKDHQLLYFGGYGSESGIQRESPRNYYDLYSIDVKFLEGRKLWELKDLSPDFTNGNSLVVNNEDQTFYTICYPNKVYDSYILLHQFDLNEPKYRILGDTIQYFFNDVESYCDLFRPEDQSQLLTLTSTLKGQGTEINIYSIAYPPLSLDDTIQFQAKPGAVSRSRWLYILIFLFAFSFFAGIYYVFKRTNRKSRITSVRSQLIKLTTKPQIHSELPSPSISLLGNFQITDSDKNDISNSFSSTTKQIFLLLLLSTTKNNRGIFSDKLRNLFWPDKDDESARNNRNVYINRLRSLLKNTGSIKILTEKGYWKIVLDDSVSCDYTRLISLISEIQEKKEINESKLLEILDLAGRGKLLPFYEIEWLDDYKMEYSNLLIEFLLEISKLPELRDNLELLLKISEIILLQDSIDESGIHLKCRVLFQIGKKKLALQCYKRFAEEYLDLLGVKTSLTFDDIIRVQK
jgi:hypothetical protein